MGKHIFNVIGLALFIAALMQFWTNEFGHGLALLLASFAIINQKVE